MANTLFVRNEVQKALFEGEVRGQLSDGMWENSVPYDHWRSYSDCKVVVAPPGKIVGRNFVAQRRYYALDKLADNEVVRDRMLQLVHDTYKPDGFNAKALRSELKDLKQIMATFVFTRED